MIAWKQGLKYFFNRFTKTHLILKWYLTWIYILFEENIIYLALLYVVIYWEGIGCNIFGNVIPYMV